MTSPTSEGELDYERAPAVVIKPTKSEYGGKFYTDEGIATLIAQERTKAEIEATMKLNTAYRRLRDRVLTEIVMRTSVYPDNKEYERGINDTVTALRGAIAKIMPKHNLNNHETVAALEQQRKEMT